MNLIFYSLFISPEDTEEIKIRKMAKEPYIVLKEQKHSRNFLK